MKKRKASVARGRRRQQVRPEERAIFRYWNGEREIAADPMLLHREFLSFPGLDMAQDMKLLESKLIPNAPQEAYGRIVGAVRKAFHVEPFSENGHGQVGLLDEECIELLGKFFVFLGDLKKKRPSLPISSTPSPTGTQAARSVTPNGAACTSTETAPCTGPPPPLPSGSATPSELPLPPPSSSL